MDIEKARREAENYADREIKLRHEENKLHLPVVKAERDLLYMQEHARLMGWK